VHIRILTSCTKQKAVSCENSITAEDFRRGADFVSDREKELSDYKIPAGRMYTGLKHRHLMHGIQTVRQKGEEFKIDLSIISAGYGVVEENEPIVPYERSFNGKSKTEIRELAGRLDIPKDTRRFLAQPADLILVLLGGNYLHVIDLDEEVRFGGDTIFLCSQSAVDSLPDWRRVKKIPVTQQTSRQFSEALVRLKGLLAKRLLVRLLREPITVDRLMQPQTDVIDILDDEALQTELELY